MLVCVFWVLWDILNDSYRTLEMFVRDESHNEV